MTNADLINRIAATIRRVDGDHTMGAGALAEAIAEDLGEIQVQSALAERIRIVAEIREQAERVRRESYTPTAGIALGALVDSVADQINTLPE